MGYGVLQVYADVCWHMLTYADVCRRMLTYADGMEQVQQAVRPQNASVEDGAASLLPQPASLLPQPAAFLRPFRDGRVRAGVQGVGESGVEEVVDLADEGADGGVCWPRTRYRMRVLYDGANYNGWQLQHTQVLILLALLVQTYWLY